jgi:leucine dehydrogenase
MNEVKVEPSKKLLFEEIGKMGHEQVVFCYDEPTGLKAIIGIHNTVLGPGIGGTRMWHYQNEDEAIIDVLRLSKAMTYKAAISGLNAGGGKAVIIGNAKTQKNEILLRRFGRFIDSLGGRYWTAEDVNMSSRDMELISMETDYVTGLPEARGGSGDPSPVTAYGVYIGMKAALKQTYGSESLQGKKIAVQGVGQVGYHLVELLTKENAIVYVSDIYNEKLERVSKQFKVNVVNQDEIFDLDVDIYAPCALGGTVNFNTIPRLRCKIIAGGANNQLENEALHGEMLVKRGIVFAPDFLINAGGLMNVYAEYQGGYNRAVVYTLADGIYNTLLGVLDFADSNGITPQQAAIQVASKRIDDIGKIKLSY